MVIAAWLTECAILWLDEIMREQSALVTMEDLGIERVRIGGDWDSVAAIGACQRRGPNSPRSGVSTPSPAR